MLGYSAEELASLTFADITHPDDIAESRECVRCLLAREQSTYHFEKRYIKKDGTSLWVDINTTLVENEQGQPQHFITGIQDISVRKQAEAERERLLSAIEQAGEMIVITDPEGIILYVNPAFERTTGYGREEVLGQNPRIMKSGRQDKAFYHQLWKTISEGRTWEGLMVNRRKNGEHA